MNYIIVSHYTDKYKPYADNLKRSCEDKNIPCVIAYVLKQGTWVKEPVITQYQASRIHADKR